MNNRLHSFDGDLKPTTSTCVDGGRGTRPNNNSEGVSWMQSCTIKWLGAIIEHLMSVLNLDLSVGSRSSADLLGNADLLLWWVYWSV